ncbi:T9SS C-terminal target domain-containing protein [Hymenobacter sediminis]|uniref:T9SS type A sorting domain-containing protein n=1 Tax=Hymenobacter sediminis TaxID=2218621 RepID=UPI000DA6D660|nr:T9SS type A sorting domain-containing protein [Hymenobacter sediminis]RPD45245.1 T9SS C-terminal target domain-containing protein [Hymenobacter sediminis]
MKYFSTPLFTTARLALLAASCLLTAATAFGQNKYQVAGEAILDKLNTKFYNASNNLYVERIDGNEKVIVERGGASYVWPASHMLRALRYGALANPAKYTERLKSYAYALDKYLQNGKYASDIVPGADPLYDDNAIVGLALMDAYQQVLPNETDLYTRSLIGLNYCLKARDANWGVPQKESELGWGKFYSQATILPALHCALIAKNSSDPQYLDIAKRYYDKINDVNWKLRDGTTNLLNQYSFYENNRWSLTGHGENGAGYRAYQTTPNIQLALKLYQLTGDSRYLDDAKVMADACLKQWYTPGKGVSEISFWGGSDIVEMLVDFYEVDRNVKWLNAARNIVDYLIDYNRDQLGYYPSSYNDSDGTWNQDRRYLFPASVNMMGQACAAAAILRVAQVTNTPLATTSPVTAKSTDFMVFPNPVVNRLSLKANRKLAGGNVRVCNSLGQVVIADHTYADSLDVSALTPGVYIVSWSSGVHRLSQRFVKK